jgi:hypothetical protein
MSSCEIREEISMGEHKKGLEFQAPSYKKTNLIYQESFISRIMGYYNAPSLLYVPKKWPSLHNTSRPLSHCYHFHEI